MADAAEQFAGNWFRKNPKAANLLVLIGNTGSGKTHTARALVNWADAAAVFAWEQGHWDDVVPSRLLVSWPLVTDGFKEGHYDILQDLFTVELLAIDDIGSENDPSKNAADKLCQVLSRRERMFTIITTNIQPQNWATAFDLRIADRLLRRSTLVDVSAVPSYATI